MATPDQARAEVIRQIIDGELDGIELVTDDPHEAGQYNPPHGHNESEEMEV